MVGPSGHTLVDQFVLAAQGMKLRARRSAEAALALAPGHAAIQQLLTELGGAGSEPPPEPPAAGGGLLDRFRRKP